jgi:hypothetical protein
LDRLPQCRFRNALSTDHGRKNTCEWKNVQSDTGWAMKKLFLTSIAALFVATGTLRLAQATERYSVRCKGQLFTVYGHHGYMVF